MSPIDLATILPELVLVLAGSALVLADAFAPWLRPRFGLLAGLSAVVALVLRWA